MPRRTKTETEAAPTAEEPRARTATRIHRDSVYDLESARHALGLPRGCLPREIRLKRLRVSKRSGRYFLLGQWLLEWLQSGELTRAKAEPASNGVGNGER